MKWPQKMILNEIKEEKKRKSYQFNLSIYLSVLNEFDVLQLFMWCDAVCLNLMEKLLIFDAVCLNLMQNLLIFYSLQSNLMGLKRREEKRTVISEWVNEWMSYKVSNF